MAPMRQFAADEVRLTPVRRDILLRMAEHLDAGRPNDLRSLAQAAGIRPLNLMIYHIDRLEGGGYARWTGGQAAITDKGRAALVDATAAKTA